MPNPQRTAASERYSLHELYRMVRVRQGRTAEEPEHEEIPRFRFAYFNLRLLIQFLLLLSLSFLALKATGRTDVLRANLQPSLGGLAKVCGVWLVIMCFSEYFLHLYPMHKGLYNPSGNKDNVLTRWMKAIKHSHDAVHHGSTKVGLDRKVGKIVSSYAITEPKQTASATFPKLALVGFWALFALPVAFFQWLWPTLPIVLGAALVITWAMALYENIHSLYHLPEEWWRRQCNRYLLGRVLLALYMHHFVHHINTRRNLNVGGVLLVPVADLTLGSFVNLWELMNAWLHADRETDLTEVIDRAVIRLQRKPWSWQIRSTLAKVFTGAG